MRTFHRSSSYPFLRKAPLRGFRDVFLSRLLSTY